MHRLSRFFAIATIVFFCAPFFGCAPKHAHKNEAAIVRCEPPSCARTLYYPDMRLQYSLVRDAETGQFVLQGTAEPRNPPQNAVIDIAVLDVDLVRDTTVAQSFSIPLLGTSAAGPLRFHHVFTADGGFDGLSFNWDIHFRERQ
ncbi:hypothetical protein [Pseudodesulfovibrio tunisiensis]|uniref:hypothetical protein n=1 Tax=Pseudodesulfovibrio tunisiensis TaxID=463192 RepID=UPI001FB3101B|nr:hypothetical protein [Pseudodesulfovibrio tunisiensis]